MILVIPKGRKIKNFGGNSPDDIQRSYAQRTRDRLTVLPSKMSYQYDINTLTRIII